MVYDKNKKEEQINELTEKMNTAVKNFKNNKEDEIDLLNALSKFKKYSANNVLLIKAQYRGAYGVGSYKSFKEKGYQVQKGEKSNYIYAPSNSTFFKDENGKRKLLKKATKEQKEKIKNGLLKKENSRTGFILVPVFDITQTDCPAKDYPKLYPNKPENFDFGGTDKQFEALKKSLNEYAEEKNIVIKTGKTGNASKGYFVPATNEILIKDTLSETEQTKVLLHELAHAEMHNQEKMNTKDNDLKAPNVLEYQAEMTAYVVSNTFELDSESYSKNYLASWTKRDVEDKTYVKSLVEVKEVSSKMIENITEKYQVNTREEIQEEAKISFTKTESKHVPIEKEMTLDEAEILLRSLNIEKKESDELGYDKTFFNIKYKLDGQEKILAGRYDIGSEELGMIESVEKDLHDNLKNPLNEKDENRPFYEKTFNEILPQIKSSMTIKPYDELHADKLNFLSKDGKNYYSELKYEKMDLTGIKEIKHIKSNTDYLISLSDKKGNEFSYVLRSGLDSNQVKENFSGDKSAQDWLELDIKKMALNNNPNLNIKNPVPENTNDLQNLNDLETSKVQNKSSELSL